MAEPIDEADGDAIPIVSYKRLRPEPGEPMTNPSRPWVRACCADCGVAGWTPITIGRARTCLPLCDECWATRDAGGW